MATPDQIRARGRWSLVLGTLIAALILVGVAAADQLDADADALATSPPSGNGAAANQQPGTTVEYNLSAAIDESGNATDDVFVNAGDKADVSIVRSGDWLASPAGSPASFTFTAYGTNQAGTIRIAVPCGTSAGTARVMSAVLTAVASNGKSLSQNPVTLTWTITAQGADAPSCTPVNTAPTADAGGPYTGNEGASILLDGSGSTDEGSIASYAWWVTPQSGGGSDPDAGASCSFVDGTSSGDEQPKVSCTDDGIYDVSLTVTDNDGATDGDSTTLTLSNVDPTATPGIPASSVDEGSSFVLALSSPTDQGANDTFTYQFDCGDGSGYGAATTTAGETCGTNDDGPRSVKLKILDDDGGFTEYTGTVTVVNVPPVITSFTCPTDPVAVNTPVTLSGAFTDVGTADTHTASIVWGDGSSSATTVTQGAGSGSVTGGHIYTAAGIYTPQLTVTDDDGGSDSETCEYVVVYDPSAGFVTGGGWIWSPAGAYLADPTMTGKATFGFVSKYKKGATTPEGSTEFQFHAAGLNFKSTSYQWLVVAGSRATYKGWGTINGQGSYGFLLAAVDGSPDKFRIKIWDVGSGGVVYDNNLGGGDDADPATALGGGSIVIHTGKK